MKKAFKITLLVICAILILPLSFAAIVGIPCKVNQHKLKNHNSQNIAAFNEVSIDSANPSVKSKVYLGGDCFDSDPFLQVSKTYSVDTTAGALIPDIRDTLAKQHYVLSNEKFTMDICGPRYEANVSKDSVHFTIAATSRAANGCNNTRSNLDENQFSSQKITSLSAKLKT